MIPVVRQEKFQLSTLPWACLFFFLAYLVVYFAYQGHEQAERQQLLSWYQKSGLFSMEWNDYISWLRINDHVHKAQRLSKDYKNGDRMTPFLAMAFDPAFEKDNRLNGNRYWSPRRLAQWQELRQTFHQKAQDLPQQKAGLIPDAPRPSSYLTWHFLQANLIQWLVALAVLAPFAWLVEAELGWKRMSLLWMLIGVFAGLGYVMFMDDSYHPLVGSTPIVSGIIGMFLAHYGRDRIPFITLHPKTRKKLILELPAWVLAPLWLLLPLYEHFGGSSAPDVWIAQVSGLIAGAILVHLARDTNVEGEEDSEEAQEDDAARELRTRLSSGWSSMAALQFTEAAHQFEKVLTENPNHFDALTGLYQVRKLKPDTDEYRHCVERLLACNPDEPGRLKQQHRIYRESTKRLEAESLPLQTRLQLVMRFVRIEELKDADQIIRQILERKEQHELLPKTLMALSEAYDQLGDNSRAGRYKTLAENAREAVLA